MSLPRLAAWLVILALAPSAAATAADSYGYPFEDPLVATVAGTPRALQADLEIDPDYELLGLEVLPDRRLADEEYVWYLDKFRYLLLKQEGRAPLAFVISGTGGSYSGARINVLTALLYKAGFHVAAIPSPTSMSFVATASRLGVPGLPWVDAADLLEVMKLAWQRQISRKVEVDGFYLAGYSLGATHAAWVSWLDDREQVFGFRRVLMINPSVNLFRSVSVLDGFMDLFSGPEEVIALWDDVIKRVSRVYASKRGISFSEDFLYTVLREERPPDEVLAKLIGLVFRISAQSMIVAADRVTRYGYIIPPDAQVKVTDNVDAAFMVSARTGFSDYFRDMLVPYFLERGAAASAEQLIADAGLAPLRQYLEQSDKIGVMHNADDFIVTSEDIDWLRSAFGDRAVIWPRGGHCGNMAYRDNVAWATRFMLAGNAP